jgi:hypothetical protein
MIASFFANSGSFFSSFCDNDGFHALAHYLSPHEGRSKLMHPRDLVF